MPNPGAIARAAARNPKRAAIRKRLQQNAPGGQQYKGGKMPEQSARMGQVSESDLDLVRRYLALIDEYDPQIARYNRDPKKALRAQPELLAEARKYYTLKGAQRVIVGGAAAGTAAYGYNKLKGD